MSITELLRTRPVSNRARRRAELARERKRKKRAASPQAMINDKMRSKYRKFENMRGPALIANMIYTWTGDFLRSGPLQSMYSNTGPNSTQFAYEDMTAKAKEELSKEATFLKITPPKKDQKTGKKIDGSALVRMAVPKYNVSLRMLGQIVGFHPSSNPDENKPEFRMAQRNKEFRDNADEVEKQLRKIFPTFKFPTKYKIEKNDLGHRKLLLDMPDTNSPIMKIDTLEKIAGSLAKDFKNSEFEIVDGFPAFDPMMEAFENEVEIQFRIIADEAVIAGVDSSRIDKLEEEIGESGQIEQISNINLNAIGAALTISVDVYMRYPLEYALWSTCSVGVDDFDPSLFAQFHNMRMDKSINKKTASSNPGIQVSGMDKVAQAVRLRQEKFKYRPPARTNAENFCATKTGLIVWVPPVDNTVEYSKLSKSRYNPDTGEISYTGAVSGLRNMVVFADWMINKLTYTTADGALMYRDLSGASPVSDQTIFSYINAAIDQGEKGNNTPSAGFKSISRIIGHDEVDKIVNTTLEKWRNAHKDYRQFAYRYSSAADVLSSLLTLNPKLTIAEIFNHDLLKDDYDPKTQLRFYCDLEIAQGLYDAAWQVLKKERLPDSASLALRDRIEGIQFSIALGAVYAKEFETRRESYYKEVERNKLNNVDVGDWKLKISNMPGLVHIMPHQVDWLGALDINEPVNAIESVSVGGGKAPMGIAEAVLFIQKKKIKRALIVMPTNLIPQYASEIEFFSKGKLNPFPITSETIENLKSNIEDFDDQSFVRLVKKAPPNTIFISTYDFVKAGDATNPEKQLIAQPEGDVSSILITGNEMVYGPFTMGGKISGQGRYPGAKIFPMVELLSRCGFDFIGLDESHRAKETASSDVAIAAANLMATAKYKRFLSGTIVTDKPIDLVGPMSMIAPEAFGSKDDFKDRYMKNGSLNVGAGQLIETQLVRHSGSVTKTLKDWAFIMPDIIQSKVSAKMTPMQARFYDILMQEAKIKYNDEMQLIIGSKVSQDKIDDFFEQFEENEKSPSHEDSEEDLVLQERMEEAAKKSLHRVEVFLAAPDEDRAPLNDEDEGRSAASFKNFDPKPSKDDLISPKAKAAYAILRAHFRGEPFLDIKKDESQYNKVVIFSYNKVVSRHIMRHMPPELKKMAIRYVASPEPEDRELGLKPGKQALYEFMNNDKIKILIADETSMAEGFNLQMASRLIRVQTTWSPGRQEQVNGRVLRPDPKGKYNRDEIFVNLLAVSHPDGKVTVDDAKIARMLSKIISKARIDYRNDRDWVQEMEEHPDLKELGLVTMNLNNIDNMDKDDLAAYEQATRTYTAWQSKQFEKTRLRLLEKLRKKYGPDVQLADVRRLAMEEVEHQPDIDGTARYFYPYAYGQTIHDHYELDLVPIIQLDLDGDEEDEDEGDSLQEGQLVMTQYGPGYVQKVFVKMVRVDIPGFGRASVPRGTIMVPATEEGQRRFENMMGYLGEKGAPTINQQGVPQKLPDMSKVDLNKERPRKFIKKPEPVYDDADDEDDDEDEEETYPSKNPIPIDDDDEVVIEALSISGMPALWMQEDDEKLRRNFLKRFPSFNILPAYLAIQIKTYQAFETALELMVNSFDISPERIEYLEEAAQNMRGARGKLVFDGSRISNQDMKNFFMLSHRKIRQPKKPGAKKVVKPWLILWHDSAYLCFDERSHPSNLSSMLRIKIVNKMRGTGGKLKGVSEVMRRPDVDEGDNEKIMMFFHTKQEAANMLKRIDEHYTIVDREDVIQELREAKTIKVRTSKPSVKTAPKMAPKKKKLVTKPKVKAKKKK